MMMNTNNPHFDVSQIRAMSSEGMPSAQPLRISRLLFDRRDYELIRIINDVSSRSRDLDYIRRQYYSYFHPHGIKEMAESRSLRIAYAMVHLLTSLEIGGMDERLSALRSLRAEVLDTAEGPMPKNTARVLMHIMKEVVRTRGDQRLQLELAHDFRITASGKPREVRKQLRRYHLLEMPEEWNQISFDDHVHDANTKGRKSSTHLIMDAWIKGIRRLRVVHYNYIEPRFAAELLEAARILEIDVRIGIEFYAPFRGKFINLIWVPRGFPDSQAFLCFLEEPAVVALMNEGRRASAYQQAYVMDLLETFDRRHRLDLNRAFNIEMEALDRQQFLSFVGTGQKSTLHLEKFIQQKLLDGLQRKADQLRTDYPAADEDARQRIAAWFAQMDRLDLEEVAAGCLKAAKNPDLPDHGVPRDAPDVPALLKLSPAELVHRLAALQSGYRITLNLSNLVVADVLELIYDCNGIISRLELFNLKDWASGNTVHIPAISRLHETLNSRNPIKLKRVIREIIEAYAAQNKSEDDAPARRIKRHSARYHHAAGDVPGQTAQSTPGERFNRQIAALPRHGPGGDRNPASQSPAADQARYRLGPRSHSDPHHCLSAAHFHTRPKRPRGKPLEPRDGRAAIALAVRVEAHHRLAGARRCHPHDRPGQCDHPGRCSENPQQSIASQTRAVEQ